MSETINNDLSSAENLRIAANSLMDLGEDDSAHRQRVEVFQDVINSGLDPERVHDAMSVRREMKVSAGHELGDPAIRERAARNVEARTILKENSKNAQDVAMGLLIDLATNEVVRKEKLEEHVAGRE